MGADPSPTEKREGRGGEQRAEEGRDERRV